MKNIIDYINEAIGDYRYGVSNSTKIDKCPGSVMQGRNHKKTFQKGDIVYINKDQDIDSNGKDIKNANLKPAKIVGIRVLKASNNFPGSQYLIDYSYEDDDRNVYTMNAKDIWNEIHIK